MTRRIVIPLLALTLASVIPIDTTWAAVPRIPSALYPANAQIAFLPSVSNHRMDSLGLFL